MVIVTLDIWWCNWSFETECLDWKMRKNNLWRKLTKLNCRIWKRFLTHTIWKVKFLSKNSTLISRFFWRWKTRENVVVLGFLAVDKFDFKRKIVKKNLDENSWKCWGFVKIEFLDNNFTFRIVWLESHAMMQSKGMNLMKNNSPSTF